MSNLLLAVFIGWGFVALVYPAVCVWIFVRLFIRPKRWVKWTFAGLLVFPVLYLASYGPLAWASYHEIWGHLPGSIEFALGVYSLPLQLTISDKSPRWLQAGMIWYLGFWVR